MKHKNTIKIIALLLSVLFLVPILAECGSGNAAENTGEETRGGKGTTLARREGGAPAVRRALCGRDGKTGKEAVGLFPGFGFRR